MPRKFMGDHEETLGDLHVFSLERHPVAKTLIYSNLIIRRYNLRLGRHAFLPGADVPKTILELSIGNRQETPDFKRREELSSPNFPRQPCGTYLQVAHSLPNLKFVSRCVVRRCGPLLLQRSTPITSAVD